MSDKDTATGHGFYGLPSSAAAANGESQYQSTFALFDTSAYHQANNNSVVPPPPGVSLATGAKHNSTMPPPPSSSDVHQSSQGSLWKTTSTPTGPNQDMRTVGGSAPQHQPPAADQFSFRPPGNVAPAYPANVPTGPRHGRALRGGRETPYNGSEGSRKPRTAQRPLLRRRHSATPEPLIGTSESGVSQQRFKSREELSPSSNEAAEQSEGDASEDSASQDSARPPVKKHKVNTPSDADEDKEILARPKWSNPVDSSLAVAPPEPRQRKGRNIVDIIRKARVESEAIKNKPSQVEKNDDFIALESESDAGDEELDIVEKLSEIRKRKRSLEPEDTVDLQQPHLKKSTRQFRGGPVLPEWQAKGPDMNTVLWYLESPEPFMVPSFRLHKDIIDFYEFIKPRPFEDAMRCDLLARLQAVVTDWDPNCEVYSFGSFAAGLYLPNADMDVVVVSKSFLQGGVPCSHTKTGMYPLSKRLRNLSFARKGSIEVIAKAKVPIIKFVDHVTSLRVDISFENLSGVANNRTFNEWKKQHPAMPVIVIIVKQFLVMRGLSDVASGGLGGFSVICLVQSFLTNLPHAQVGISSPTRNLGEFLIDFLDFYGSQFDYLRNAISMDPPGYLKKHDLRAKGTIKRMDRLTIIHPNTGNDIAGGSQEIDLIFERFSAARESILSALRAKTSGSPLEWMLGGNYNDALWQRRRLKELHEGKHQAQELQAQPSKISPIDTVNDLDSADKTDKPLNTRALSQAEGLALATDKIRAKAFRNRFRGVLNVPDHMSKHELSRAKHALLALKASANADFQDLLRPAQSTHHVADRSRASTFRRDFKFVSDVPPELTKEAFRNACNQVSGIFRTAPGLKGKRLSFGEIMQRSSQTHTAYTAEEFSRTRVVWNDAWLPSNQGGSILEGGSD